MVLHFSQDLKGCWATGAQITFEKQCPTLHGFRTAAHRSEVLDPQTSPNDGQAWAITCHLPPLLLPSPFCTGRTPTEQRHLTRGGCPKRGLIHASPGLN